MPEPNSKYQENLRLLNDPRIQSLLKTIRSAEGATYNTRVGGSTFDDLSKKPGVMTRLPKLGIKSSAEGAYQFLNKTWDNVSKDLGLKDFSPLSQDIAAVELIKRRGALDNLLRGDFQGSINKLSPEWASLPTASGKGYYSGQKARRIDDLQKIYLGEKVPKGTYESFISPTTYSHSKIIDLESSPVDLESSTVEYIEPEVEEAKQEIETKSFVEDLSKIILSQQSEQTPQNIQPQVQGFVPSDLPDPYNYIEADPGYNFEEFQNGGATRQDSLDLYNNRKVTPQYQDGGIQASKDFTENWYKNRVLPDENLNAIYQAEKDLYVNQASNLPDPTYVDKIDDFNTQGTYDPQTGQINILKTATPLVYTHEGAHKINLPLKDTQSNVNAFSVIGQNILPKDKIQNQWVKDNYQQISNYQEVIPRLNSYRQLHGLKPDQVITPELIQNNRDLYKQGKIPYEDNTDQLYKMFENEGLSNVLNKVVSNDTNAIEFFAQDGGFIPVSENGMYEYPNQKVIVPTSGNITMKEIEHPILGISQETGEQIMMQPGQEYFFENTKNVLEIPVKNKKINNRFK